MTRRAVPPSGRGAPGSRRETRSRANVRHDGCRDRSLSNRSAWRKGRLASTTTSRAITTFSRRPLRTSPTASATRRRKSAWGRAERSMKPSGGGSRLSGGAARRSSRGRRLAVSPVTTATGAEPSRDTTCTAGTTRRDGPPGRNLNAPMAQGSSAGERLLREGPPSRGSPRWRISPSSRTTPSRAAGSWSPFGNLRRRATPRPRIDRPSRSTTIPSEKARCRSRLNSASSSVRQAKPSSTIKAPPSARPAGPSPAACLPVWR